MLIYLFLCFFDDCISACSSLPNNLASRLNEYYHKGALALTDSRDRMQWFLLWFGYLFTWAAFRISCCATSRLDVCPDPGRYCLSVLRHNFGLVRQELRATPAKDATGITNRCSMLPCSRLRVSAAPVRMIEHGHVLDDPHEGAEPRAHRIGIEAATERQFHRLLAQSAGVRSAKFHPTLWLPLVTIKAL